MHSTDCFQIMSLKDPVASGCDSELFICKVKLRGATLQREPDVVMRRTGCPHFPSLEGSPCSAALPRHWGDGELTDNRSAPKALLHACALVLLQEGLWGAVGCRGLGLVGWKPVLGLAFILN